MYQIALVLDAIKIESSLREKNLNQKSSQRN